AIASQVQKPARRKLGFAAHLVDFCLDSRALEKQSGDWTCNACPDNQGFSVGGFHWPFSYLCFCSTLRRAFLLFFFRHNHIPGQEIWLVKIQSIGILWGTLSCSGI